MHRDDLDVPNGRSLRRGRRDDRRFRGQPRERRRRDAQPRGGVAQRLLELVADRELLRRAERWPWHEALDEVAIAEIRRDAARRRMRVRQKTEVLEGGELVANRRRRDVQVVAADELRRSHRLRGRDVLADHGAEKLLRALVQLGKAGGMGFSSQLALSRREC